MMVLDKGIILFIVFLPLAYPVIYSLIYNPELVREVPMVVVDHDRTSSSRELVRRMDASQSVWIRGYAANLPEARRAMAQRDCFGILEIPAGFGRHIGSGEQAVAAMYCDMSLLLRYRGFLMASVDVASEFGAELQAKKIGDMVPAGSSLEVGDPMPVASITMGNIESGFDSFIMPGIVVLILQQCIILSIGMMGGAMHEDPRRIGYDPVNLLPSTTLTLTAKALCYITVLAFPIIFLLHYIPLLFAFPIEGQLWQIIAFIMPMILASCSLGFCLQTVMTERESIFVVWVVTSVIFLFLSGLTWPRFAMPAMWKLLSGLVPATWGIEGFIRMNSNGADLSQVADEYLALWALAIIYGIAAFALHRFVIRPRLRRRVAAQGSASR